MNTENTNAQHEWKVVNKGYASGGGKEYEYRGVRVSKHKYDSRNRGLANFNGYGARVISTAYMGTNEKHLKPFTAWAGTNIANTKAYIDEKIDGGYVVEGGRLVSPEAQELITKRNAERNTEEM